MDIEKLADYISKHLKSINSTEQEDIVGAIEDFEEEERLKIAFLSGNYLT
jgi:hypothetical protein